MSTTETFAPEYELRIIGDVIEALDQLEPDKEAIARVLRWATSRYLPAGFHIFNSNKKGMDE